MHNMLVKTTTVKTGVAHNMPVKHFNVQYDCKGSNLNVWYNHQNYQRISNSFFYGVNIYNITY